MRPLKPKKESHLSLTKKAKIPASTMPAKTLNKNCFKKTSMIFFLLGILLSFSQERCFAFDSGMIAGQLNLKPSEVSYGDIDGSILSVFASQTFKNTVQIGLELSSLDLSYGKTESSVLKDSLADSSTYFSSDAKIEGLLYQPFIAIGYINKNFSLLGKIKLTSSSVSLNGRTISNDLATDTKLENTYNITGHAAGTETGMILSLYPSEGFAVGLEYLIGNMSLDFKESDVSRNIPEGSSFSDELLASLKDSVKSQSVRIMLSFELF